MLYNPHEQTYGYDSFEYDTSSYIPLNLDPVGRNFEYINNNYNITKTNLPLSYDPVFINGELNKSYINNKKNIENYFITNQLQRAQNNQEKPNILGTSEVIPEDNFGTNQSYFFPSREHMVSNPISIKPILFILIAIYIILNLYIYVYQNYKINLNYNNDIL